MGALLVHHPQLLLFIAPCQFRRLFFTVSTAEINFSPCRLGKSKSISCMARIRAKEVGVRSVNGSQDHPGFLGEFWANRRENVRFSGSVVLRVE